MNQREIVIQFLLSLEKDVQNQVTVTRDIYKQHDLSDNISEKDFIRELNVLSKDGYLTYSNLIHTENEQEDLKYALKIDLKSPILHYND